MCTPPGATLREWLEENKVRQRDLAQIGGWSTKFVSQLVNGKVGLTPKTAVSLEGITGIPASFWLQRESTYQLGKLLADKS